MAFEVETKWNADNEKMAIIIALEQKLTEAFTKYDYGEVYTLLRVYRLNADPKFSETSRAEIAKDLDKLSIIFSKLKKEYKEETAQAFMLDAEDFFLSISRGLKKAGIYFREGRDASNAILERG